MHYFLMSQGSLNPRIRFLGQKLWSVARVQRNRQGNKKHTRKWLLRAPFQGFRSFSFNLSSRIGPIWYLLQKCTQRKIYHWKMSRSVIRVKQIGAKSISRHYFSRKGVYSKCQLTVIRGIENCQIWCRLIYGWPLIVVAFQFIRGLVCSL